MPGDRTLEYISSDVKIGLGYNVRIYGLSYFQVATSYVTASVTVVKDTTAPNAPTSLTANVGTGRAVSLDWADNTEADLSEYGVYRNTTSVTPANANTDKIAEVRASRFVDTEVATGTTYYYWVNAYDMLENVSGFSNRAQAIATGVTAGSVDLTPPSTPNAPTFSSEATYLASDGTALARITLTAPAMMRLVAYDWPGNVREVFQTMHRMVVMTQGETIDLRDIPDEIRSADDAGENHSQSRAGLAGVGLDKLEKEAIRQTLAMTAGNREQAAQMLGIGERTLYRKLKEYGLR